MSSIGNKIKGAVQTVHGVGENIRGTTLGAVDTITHESDNKNDQIAESGRSEVRKGMANMQYGGGNTTAARTHGGIHSTQAEQHMPAGRTMHHEGYETHPIGADATIGSGQAYGSAPAPEVHSDHPGHHREDAMSNDPTAVRVGHQPEFQQQQGNPQPGQQFGQQPTGYNQPSRNVYEPEPRI